jgi:hypothetical protein
MSGSLAGSWDYLVTELWEPLAEYSTSEGATPPDIFSDLIGLANDYLSLPLSEGKLAEVRTSAPGARQSFLELKGIDFRNEYAVVRFLEECHQVMVDYEIPGLEDLYRRLLEGILRKFNLRYRLDDPFYLCFLLPASFNNLYEELQRLNAKDPHLASLIQDFEKAFDRYARFLDPTDLKTCIHKASNYAEGIASATAGNPATGNTLGALANRLNDWPHDKVRDALVDIYHFCCDYPGIRHGGTPASARRSLAPRDVTLSCLLILSFTGYLSPSLNERMILGV